MRRRCTGFARSMGPLALAALLGGCATMGRLAFREPVFDLERVQITGLGLRGGSLNLLLDVYNPNGFDLRAGRIATEIDLAETPFGSASTVGTVAVPAGEHVVLEVPVVFSWGGVGAGARSLLRSGSIPYALRGSVFFTSPIGEHPVRVQLGGDVSIVDLVP